MAERSKALRSGRSPLLWAWVRIPLLSMIQSRPVLYDVAISAFEERILGRAQAYITGTPQWLEHWSCKPGVESSILSFSPLSLLDWSLPWSHDLTCLVFSEEAPGPVFSVSVIGNEDADRRFLKALQNKNFHGPNFRNDVMHLHAPVRKNNIFNC
ncbi:hypothetical protein M513_11077 [Trichuris suis]|uniref:Uncharacterized protein n=1 Tax=Trichuris suis TaxID=68888 RepID=A0A085LSW1_9BILA|nr:hypothetical protein M513_11077 [Trichuris suis]